MQVHAHRIHHDEDDRQHQRHRQCNDDTGAPAECEEADEQHDRQRLHERMHELADCVLDHFRLIGDLLDLDALRHGGHEFRGRFLDVLAKLENVGALRHHHADADRGLAFLAHLIGRRIDESVGDHGDVAKAEHAAIALDRSLGHGLDAVIGTGDAQRHALRRRFNRARRNHCVLLGQRIEQRLRRDAERRQLGVGEFNEHALVLRAVQIDLGDVLRLQKALAQAFGHFLELGIVRALARQHVENRIDVAVFVVDVRTDQVRRKIVPDVTELLAELIEKLRHFLRRRVVLEGQGHRGERRLGVGLHLLEVRQFLKLLLDRIGDLLLHFLGRRAGPHRVDDDHLDGK